MICGYDAASLSAVSTNINRKTSMRIIALFVLVIAFASDAGADTVELKSGRKFTGKITAETGQTVVIDVEGAKVEVKASEIKSIVRNGGSEERSLASEVAELRKELQAMRQTLQKLLATMQAGRGIATGLKPPPPAKLSVLHDVIVQSKTGGTIVSGDVKNEGKGPAYSVRIAVSLLGNEGGYIESAIVSLTASYESLPAGSSLPFSVHFKSPARHYRIRTIWDDWTVWNSQIRTGTTVLDVRRPAEE